LFVLFIISIIVVLHIFILNEECGAIRAMKKKGKSNIIVNGGILYSVTGSNTYFLHK